VAFPHFKIEPYDEISDSSKLLIYLPRMISPVQTNPTVFDGGDVSVANLQLTKAVDLC
jgi:hypothetical protein